MVRRLPNSTSIEIVDEAVARILRTKTPADKLEMVFEANRTARLLIEGALRTWHPGWTDDEINREIARRMSGAAG
jgi:hypothetical protein